MKQQVADFSMLVLAVVLGIVSYILNLGSIRITYFISFLVYNLIVLISGIIYVYNNCSEGNPKQRNIFYTSLLTYIFFNMFFPDSGDTDFSYCFFYLIKVYDNIYMYISMISLVISVVCIILNIKAIKRS